MKIFLTGATGFIGSYVAKALLDRGDSLVAYARNPDKIPSLAGHPRVQMVCGELTDLDALRSGLEGCEACVHIALGWGQTPEEMLRNDTLPSVALLDAADKAGCQQFLYTSSTAAMGKMRQPMHEDLRCIPVDLYGATKAATESFVLGFQQSSMRRNIIRPGYTFGNPILPDSFAQPDRRFREMAEKALRNEEIECVRHDGTQFIHAADLARLYLAVLDSGYNEEVFLGLAEQWVSWEDIGNRLIQLAGSQSKVKLRDLGWGSEPIRFEVQKIKQMGLQFHAWPALQDHLEWNLSQASLSQKDSK